MRPENYQPESWLTTIAIEVHYQYSQLRNDIKNNVNTWTHSDYCKRLAYHYYNLGMCYYEQFHELKTNLYSVKTCLEKCLRKLREIPSAEHSKEMKDMETYALTLFMKVNDTIENNTKPLTQNSDSVQRLGYLKRCIVLGNLSDITLQEVDEHEIKQRIQSIQRLRIIDELEEEITLTEQKDRLVLADVTDTLGKVYQSVGAFVLAENYHNTAQRLLKTILFETKTDSPMDKKQKIEDTVRKKLEEYNSLNDVDNYIEEEHNTSLSGIDRAYIERKYVKHSVELFLQDVSEFFKEKVEAKDRHTILEIFKQLDTIQTLRQLPDAIQELRYCKLLLKHYSLLDEKQEKLLIRRLKQESLEQTMDFSESAKNELLFLKFFVKFLSNFKNAQMIVAELQLQAFYSGGLSFDDLIENILALKADSYGDEFAALQAATQSLKNQDDIFLIDKFKEIIKDYIKPADVNVKTIDGRMVVEVIGRNVVVSDVLGRIQTEFVNNPGVEEVRFVCKDVLYIDIDLKPEFWHGKNIVIFTKLIKVCDIVTWNVSGNESSHAYRERATDGNGATKHGASGMDGHAGKSGGNVLMLAERVENPESLTFISNGGSGGKGQDGGNGVDGKDGKGITNSKFNDNFSSVAKFFAGIHSQKNIKKTVENIDTDSSTLETVWYNGTNDTSHAALRKIGNTAFDKIFIEAKTEDGKHITFSHFNGFSCNGFVLYKGSAGTSGGDGGDCGLGGQGGYAGEISISDPKIVVYAKQGQNGENGKGGSYGCPGINGWDIGYVDSQFWGSTEYYGANQTSKCMLKYYSRDSSSRVWCPYKDDYAEIEAAQIDKKNKKTLEQTKTTNPNRELQRQAQAIGKKTISRSSVLTNYSHHLISEEKDEIQDLQSELESTEQRAKQAITENEEHKEKQTVELGVRRHVSIASQNKRVSHNITFDTKTGTQQVSKQNIENLLQNLKSNTASVDDWNQLKNIELNQEQLQNLQSSKKVTLLPETEKLLLDKYKFATLYEIAKQMPVYYKVEGSLSLSSERAARYLVKTKASVTNFTHADLGSLSRYLFENSDQQRENLVKFCKELEKENKEEIKRFIEVFVCEVGDLKVAHASIKKYFDEYNEFLDDQERDVSIKLEAFKTEISQPKHAELLDLWNKTVENEPERKEFEEKVKKDKGLFDLYKLLDNRLIQEYDWKKCCEDSIVLKEFEDHIRDNGPLSESCRELLAHFFDVNIRLYAEDDDGKLSLVVDHNPHCMQILNVLYTDDGFFELTIDEQYLNLEKDRKKKTSLYPKIVQNVDRLHQKQEIDNYLKEKTFTRDEDSDYHYHDYHDYHDYHAADDMEDLGKILAFFPSSDQGSLKQRLEKITSDYIGSESILRAILKQFSCNGANVSVQELYCLVNTILASLVEDKNQIAIVHWIVSAYPQNRWIDEIVLLQLEDTLRTALPEKPEWRNYLSTIENKDILELLQVKLYQQNSKTSISTKCIGDALYLLSNIPNGVVNLLGLGLTEWPYALKEQFWSNRLAKLTTKEELPIATYYLLSIENIFEMDLVEKFVNILKSKQQELTSGALLNILSNLHNERWNLNIEDLDKLKTGKISEWQDFMQKKYTADERDRDVTKLVKLINCNANTFSDIKKQLPDIENKLKLIKNHSFQSSILKINKTISKFDEKNIKEWVTAFKQQKTFSKDMFSEVLAVIDKAIELRRGFKLRDTQKLTIMAILTTKRNTLAQVSTGEGKSLIVVAASIIKALRGEKIDIVTSSSVLAKRDAEENKDLYNLFDVNVSHNCNEDIEKRKDAYSGNQVVYGDLSNFQRDYLLDKFYLKNILGDRNFENVIIDEVDSMLLDKGNNMLYLSHNLPGLDKLESVYLFIWQWLNRPAKSHDELLNAFDGDAIKEAVINDIYGLVRKEDLTRLGSDLKKYQIKILWERLITAKIIDDQGKLSIKKVDAQQISEIISPEFITFKDRLCFLLKQCIERERYIHVPNYLRPFIEQHLDSWIKSAISAFFMKVGQDYVVDVDRTGTNPDRNPNITILDRDTGTDQANSQWEEALHQFLQLKHGCKLSLQSLKAVFISNVSFFKLYTNLYGLTGTLGSHRERELLKEIHEVDFVTIPTAKSKRFQEAKPYLCSFQEEWHNKIYDEVNILTQIKKRSVLIICETVDAVQALHSVFGGKNAKHVHTYTRDYEEFNNGSDRDNKKLGQGKVIISTNLSGRGTDIKITEGLRKAGGLHVCLTYLPSNSRIEQQAFGRAARSGDPGSGQLIIMAPEGQEYSSTKILEMKNDRDAEELRRTTDIKTYFETQITVEENCFKKFKEQYERLKSQTTWVMPEIQEILLNSCLDKWAFWLDENSKRIKGLTDDQNKKSFDDSLKNMILNLKKIESELNGIWVDWRHKQPELLLIDLIKNFTLIFKSEYSNKNWSSWLQKQPAQIIKLGVYFAQHNNPDSAIKLFDEVIRDEPHFSGAAHYYKAFALAKKINWENEPDDQIFNEFKNELKEAAHLFEEQNNFSTIAAGIIGRIKQENRQSIIQIDAYEEQQKSMSNLYYLFSRSIDDIFGHEVTPQFFANFDVNEELAEDVYESLLKQGILTKPKVESIISDEKLEKISSGYGITIDLFQRFLSKFQGKEFDDYEFKKALKNEIQLPGRGAFWKLMIESKIFIDEVKYVVVDNETLEKIDPSLLEYFNKGQSLTKQTEVASSQIVLTPERFDQQNKSNNIFAKDYFIETIGQARYQFLKRKGALSFNKTANIDVSKIDSASFSCFDSLTSQDFAKVYIPQSAVNGILDDLVAQKVIEKKDDDSYRLTFTFDQFDQIELPSCPVYESTVRQLLHVCFTYRIALQKVQAKVEDKNFPISLHLMTKPYQNLILELKDQKLIGPTTLANKIEDLEEKLKNIFSETLGLHEFKNLLSQNEIPVNDTDTLFHHLVEKRWLIKPILIEMIDSLSDIIVKGEYSVPEVYSYTINISDESQPLTSYKDIEATVKLLLENCLVLSKEDTIKSICGSLERSRSLLTTLEVPDFNLKEIIECFSNGDFENIEEVVIFYLNGSNQLIQLEEKKWTLKMLLNTLAVVVIGLAQIAIGVLIELYSAGVMTHVGSAFISEGVSDLFFAANALVSGHFSWKDYGEHKKISLMTTVATFGIGALCSRGAEVSRFGQKLAGPNFQFGQNVANMTGKQLIKTAGMKVIAKEVLKRIALKSVEAVAFGLANAGIDKLVENHLHNICESIGSTILTNIDNSVDKHASLNATIKEVYDTLGEEQARRLINDLTDRHFRSQNYVEKITPIASKIANCVTQGIAQAANKRSKSGGNLALPIKTISLAVVWTERTVQLGNIYFITDSLLNDLDEKMKEKLKKEKKTAESDSKTSGDFDKFKYEIVTQWKVKLRGKAGQVIAQHIVSPILKDGANKLIRCAGRFIEATYRSYQETEQLEHFEKLKQKHRKDLQKVDEGDHEDAIQIKKNITQEYHAKLIKLLIKTRSPKLFKNLVLENIPMDMTCLEAFIQIIRTMPRYQVLAENGLTIIVEGENGIKQTFSTASEGTAGTVIELKLKDNHFMLSDGPENTNTGDSRNNCLFEALSQRLNLNMSADDFRADIANTIEHDPDIQDHIRKGLHRLPIRLGAYGGAKPFKEKLTNELKRDIESSDPYQHSEIDKNGEETGWKFNQDKDVDLREGGEQSNERLHQQRSKAFNEALRRINLELSKIDKNHKPIGPSHFEPTRHDTILYTGAFGKIKVGLFPVEMTSEVKVTIKGLGEVVYSTKIDLDNPIVAENPQGPHGPHVGYEVNRTNKQAPVGVVGHILINRLGNKDIPHRSKDPVQKERKTHNHRVPVTRLFNGPTRQKTDFKRSEAQTDHVDQRDVRGRRFPHADF